MTRTLTAVVLACGFATCAHAETFTIVDARGTALGQLFNQGAVLRTAPDGQTYMLPFTNAGGLRTNAAFAFASTDCSGQRLLPSDPRTVAFPILGQWDGSQLWKAGAQTLTLTVQSTLYADDGTGQPRCIPQRYSLTGAPAISLGHIDIRLPLALRRTFP